MHVPLLLLIGVSVAAAPAEKAAPQQAAPAPKASSSGNQTAPQAAEREARFAALLQNVVLEGHWRMTEPREDGSSTRLSTPRPERYEIVSASKLHADNWLITARIQYASHDVNLPVTVRVVWAGDTPVITVDDISLPVLGTYSARVMIYHDAYAGIWHGGGHGGVMSGTIRPQKSPAKASNPTGDAATPPE